jgi:molybdopterin-guanine dinucleotide biosynthesis protein A
LVGIATALRAAQCDFALVVACDMPLLSLPLLRAMAREPRDYDALVPALIGNRNDRAGDLALEPLHAIYSRTCVPSIDARLRAGRLKVWEFLATVRMRTLPAAWVREYDPALTSFVNANDPRELAVARALADVERPVIE